MLYTRAQVRLLLILAVTLLLGLGVREWRAGFPEVAERLERFDREEPPTPLAPTPRPGRRPPPAPQPVAVAAAETAPAREAEPARPSAGPSDPRPLDINRASHAEVARLPGVGPGLAGRILAERDRRGRFDSPEALRYVLGMGPKKLAAIRDLITVTD